MVVVLAAGCASKPWQQPATAEELVIDGSRVIRDEEDGSVSLLVVVQLEGNRSAGFVRFRNRSAFEKLEHWYGPIAEMRAWQTLALELAHEPERSLEAARRGLALGSHCNHGDLSRSLWRLDHGDPATYPASSRMADARAVLDDELRWCMKRAHPYAL